jgi:hypothetical protein
LGGLHKSDLVILAARPSMGKTALATNIGFSTSVAGTRVGFFSREMSDEQIALRILADKSAFWQDLLAQPKRALCSLSVKFLLQCDKPTRPTFVQRSRLTTELPQGTFERVFNELISNTAFSFEGLGSWAE